MRPDYVAAAAAHPRILGVNASRSSNNKENLIKMTIKRKLITIALLGFFSQFSIAQNQAAVGALREIVGIVVSINHFPSDADKAALGDISNNDSLPQGIRMIAGAVSSINHSPSDEGKQMMAQLQASARAPDQVKSLAKIIADFNHMPSEEDKTTLTQLFP